MPSSQVYLRIWTVCLRVVDLFAIAVSFVYVDSTFMNFICGGILSYQGFV